MYRRYKFGCGEELYSTGELLLRLLMEFLPEIVFTLEICEFEELREGKVDGYIVGKGSEGEFDWFVLPYNKECSLLFNYGNEDLMRLRNLFCYPIEFVGAGPGALELATYGGVEALRNCDICLYDSLVSEELLKCCGGEKIFVGKRAHRHSMKQKEINELILKYGREGRKVVRLKGGDSGIFGRLAEEVESLNNLQLSYNVLPGISSMQAATTGSGLLLTRRGLSRGFCVMTCRKEGSHDFSYVNSDEMGKLPRVYFMGITQLSQIVGELQAAGYKLETPVSVVYNVSQSDEEWIFGTIGNIRERCFKSSDPGLIMVGEGMDESFFYPKFGTLSGKRVLLTCSEELMETAKKAVKKYQGISVENSLVKLVAERVDYKNLLAKKYDWWVVTSPSSARILLSEMKDQKAQIRDLPKIMVCGKGTAGVFESNGIYPEAIVPNNYSALGLVEYAKKIFKGNENVLRLRSDLAGESLAIELEKLVMEVSEVISYRNELQIEDNLREFDGVCFASSSAVAAFVANFGEEVLAGKYVSVIGQPTYEACNKLLPNTIVRKALEATMEDCVAALAAAVYLDK
ncbi:MAG: uroporphyrinogen-III C-methyltransferase [Lentisphaeria bacterium]